MYTVLQLSRVMMPCIHVHLTDLVESSRKDRVVNAMYVDYCEIEHLGNFAYLLTSH